MIQDACWHRMTKKLDETIMMSRLPRMLGYPLKTSNVCLSETTTDACLPTPVRVMQLPQSKATISLSNVRISARPVI